MDFLTLDELQEQAGAQLAPAVFDYYRGGADDELTLADNQAAYDRLRLRYRVLHDVSQVDTRVSLLGQEASLPVLVAPTAFHSLATPEGEVATARAAAQAGTVMVLSSLSNRPLEEVTAAAPGRVWFQLYVVRDRGLTRDVVARAHAAGCQALVLTADAPRLGRRRKDVRNRFQLPPGLVLANLSKEPLPASQSDSALANYFDLELDAGLTWKDVEWLAGLSPMPVLVKGLVRGDDAVRAVEHGAGGVVVSNHGGRQLDGSVATLDALGEVAEAVGDRTLVLVDGGVRRGTDVIKALCRGARAVLLGRPILWGLACAGESGALQVLEHVRAELERAMALCGVARVGDLTEDLLAVPRY